MVFFFSYFLYSYPIAKYSLSIEYLLCYACMCVKNDEFKKVVLNMEIIDKIVDKPQDKDRRDDYVV